VLVVLVVQEVIVHQVTGQVHYKEALYYYLKGLTQLQLEVVVLETQSLLQILVDQQLLVFKVQIQHLDVLHQRVVEVVVLVLMEQMVVQVEVPLMLILQQQDQVIHLLQTHLKEMMGLQKHHLAIHLTTEVVEVVLELLHLVLVLEELEYAIV
tara:strand:- start:124 stop:582 length:459 start_codon:yes stop_codon:yes gene_type:complete